jgi:hypothetical protein
MSANLDKSLDDLVGSRRQTARRRGSRRAATKKPSVGGVKKSTKAAPKAVHPAPVAHTASSKILVSGLVSSSSSLLRPTVDHMLTSSACRCFRGQYQGMLIRRLSPRRLLPFSFVESLAAQTISTHPRTFLYLSSIDG